MADEKPKTVTITALQLHTVGAKTYKPGDTYEVDEAYATSIEIQGKGVRADAKKADPPAPAKKSK